MRFRTVVAAAVVAFPSLVARRSFPPPAPLGYFRYPALAGNELIFSAEGDLWRVPVTGGVAQPLQDEIRARPVTVPGPPAYPDQTIPPKRPGGVR